MCQTFLDFPLPRVLSSARESPTPPYPRLEQLGLLRAAVGEQRPGTVRPLPAVAPVSGQVFGGPLSWGPEDPSQSAMTTGRA